MRNEKKNLWSLAFQLFICWKLENKIILKREAKVSLGTSHLAWRPFPGRSPIYLDGCLNLSSFKAKVKSLRENLSFEKGFDRRRRWKNTDAGRLQKVENVNYESLGSVWRLTNWFLNWNEQMVPSSLEDEINRPMNVRHLAQFINQATENFSSQLEGVFMFIA